jgi:glutaredoxin
MLAPHGSGVDRTGEFDVAPSTLLKRALPALLIAALLLPGCVRDDGKDHYARAMAIERELLRRNPETGYGHPGYLSVLRELQKVPGRAAERGRADLFAQRIADGRRFAVMERYPQIDHLPRRLRGIEPPEPPRPDASGGTGVPATTPAAKQTLRRAADAATGELTAAQRERLQITMYSTSWCGYCSKARRWFADQGLPFAEHDIEKDAEAAREFERIAGRRGGVPVIVVNGQVLRGFSPTHVERAVARALEN